MPDEKVQIAKERKALIDLMDGVDFKVPNRRVDENLLIATWNIQQFSNKKTDRAIQYIADICERFDIIALQELKTDLRGLERLREMLPGNYRVLVTDPTGNNERFAFLYDKRTVVATGLVCEIGFTVPGDTHTGYQLHRMPYCASFRAGRFDFVIINAHIFYGSKKQDKAAREKEIKQLVDYIYKRTRVAKGKVIDPDFFVVGDFNIEAHGDDFFKALVSKGFKMPNNMDTLRTNFQRTRTFDKIAWVNRRSFRFSGACNVVPFGEVLYQDVKPKGGKKEISDHLPLWAEFEIKELSQELDHIIRQGG